ncbi:MAG: 1-deoxy-D-xylulose-5-phosphate synthase [Solitalea-like symbiont of Acarus siro]
MQEVIHYKFLDHIDTPGDLRKLHKHDLPTVCKELREFIIDHISKNGGHFSANLGVIELTIALHYVFDTPEDKLVWDVGHQAYAHKIITGRKKEFKTNRLYKGISGFPKMTESIYDAFGTGHSSTSISAILGMATAAMLKGNIKQKNIAVIGDGALTGGMAFEALNNAGTSKADILVILNDNGISIDPNVGSLKNYLTKITTSEPYNKMRDDAEKILDKLQNKEIKIKGFIKHSLKTIKGLFLRHSNLFEALNFRYFGPVNGHDVIKLVDTLSDLKQVPGPKILHCLTKKGKGFRAAEEDQTKWHAPGLFDKLTEEVKLSAIKNPFTKWQDVFGYTLLDLAEVDKRIVGITPAMISGSSFHIMQEKFPERVIDVAIAEQHAITFSAGLASEGLIPFCNIYSSFMQRAYDQVIHDVALQNLHVIMCIDRAGLVGADGPTHHGAFDLAYMRVIPNIIVSAPINEIYLRNLMYTATKVCKPFVIRYPRGNGVLSSWREKFTELEVGKGQKLTDGENLAIISIGHVGNFVQEAIKILNEDNIYIAHYDLIFLKPLDTTMLKEIFDNYKYIITIEDGCVQGGMGSAVIEFASAYNYKTSIYKMGIPDKFVTHGEPKDLYKECGYDTNAIVNKVKEIHSFI